MFQTRKRRITTTPISSTRHCRLFLVADCFWTFMAMVINYNGRSLVTSSTVQDLTAVIFDLTDSSIRSLGDVTCGNDNVCFKKLIRGKGSLGHFMNQEGLRAVPSPQEPGPMVRLTGTYFSGGFTVKKYGSRDEGVIDAIQMEFPQQLRKNKTAWENSRRKVARAIVNFFRLNCDSGIGVNDV